jgi:palmitoyltransferase ZDHHC13/17
MIIADQSIDHVEHNDLIDSNEPLVRELFNAVRYGLKAQVAAIIEKNPNLINNFDDQGNSCTHWAAKKGDTDMLELLANSGASLNLPTLHDVHMLPIHWAASEGKIKAINFFLERRQDINAQDANGCTPVIIAAQHNRLNCVIFLIKNGADLSLKDVNGDGAIHWAAYKGYVEMIGLLAYLYPHDTDSEDAYGQVSNIVTRYGELLLRAIYDCNASV